MSPPSPRRPDDNQLFVGRQQEIVAIRRCIDTPSTGSIILLEGEAGIGKSTLLDIASARARRDRMVVLRAGAEELLDARPFSLVSSAVASVSAPTGGPSAQGSGGRSAADRDDLLELADRLVRNNARDASSPSALMIGHAAPAALVEVALERIETVAEGRRVLMVLDDLQWADATSLLALGPIARRVVPLGVVLIMAFRPVPRPYALDRLIDILEPLGADLHRIGPLTSGEVDRLLAIEAGGEPDATLRRLATGAAGNPFYVVELVRGLDRAGRLQSSGDEVAATGAGLPVALRRGLLRQLRQHGEEAVEILRIAAVLGRTLQLEELAVLSGRSMPTIVASLGAATSAGLLLDDGERLRFRHDLVRDALVEEIPGPLRAALHRDAARMLEERGAPPERIAAHLLHGADADDKVVLDHLRSVAARSVPTVAAQLLELVLAASDPEDADSAIIACDTAEAMLWSGRVEEAIDLSRAWIDRTGDVEVVRRIRAAGCHALFLLGRPGEAVSLWQSAPVAQNKPTEAFDAAELSLARLFAGDVAGAHTDAQRSLDAVSLVDASSSNLGSQTVRLLSHCTLAWTTGVSGDLVGALAHADAAVACAEAEGFDTGYRYGPHLFRAVILDGMGEMATALATIEEGRTLTRATGAAVLEPFWHAMRSVLLFRSGDWDEALAEVDAGMSASEDSGLRLTVNWLAAVRSLVLLQRGDVAGAAQVLDATTDFANVLGQDWAMLARARLLDATDQPEDAANLVSVLASVSDSIGARSAVVLVAPMLASYVATRTADESIASLCRLAWIGADAPAVLQAQRDWCRGLLDHQPDLVNTAAAILAGAGRRVDAGHAWHDAAVALAPDRPDDARTAGRKALEMYDLVGAVPAASRLRAQLRAHAIRVRVEPPRRAVSGWDAITPTESRVVELVAEGLTNGVIAERLFISRRTVESHLVRVYAKLETGSRVELAKMATSRLQNQLAIEPR